MKETIYIYRRRLQAFLTGLCFYLCRIFPINTRRIHVTTFEGRGGFGCNPRPIIEELHRRHPSLEIIWLVNDMTQVMPSYIKKVPNTFWQRIYSLTTSKIWLDNYRKPYGTIKRQGQYYLNTNHYTNAIKCTGRWRGKGFSIMAELVSLADSANIDALIIDSKWCEEVMPKAMLFTGTYLRTGAPRADILYGDRSQAKRALRARHKLPQDAKIIMYAPTFREGAIDGKRKVFSAVWTIDFSEMLASLARRFGGEWYLCIRVHPQLASTFDSYEDEKLRGRIIDESQASDMYEIMAGVNAYLTDYSSAIFEAGLAGLPSFIYADDIDDYAHDRGELFWNLATDPHDQIRANQAITPNIEAILPFVVNTNNEELRQTIEKFDEEEYQSRLAKFQNDLEITFDGKATKRIVAELERQLGL